MKKKSTWILAAFLANLALLPLVVAQEGRAQRHGDSFLFHCCKKTSSGIRYCCDWCCVFTWNCTSDQDCRKKKER